MPTVTFKFRRFETRDLVACVALAREHYPESIAWRWGEFRDWVRTARCRVYVLACDDGRRNSVLYGYVTFIEEVGRVVVRQVCCDRWLEQTLECYLKEIAGGRVLEQDEFCVLEGGPRE